MNEKNKNIITQIKKDLLNKTFKFENGSTKTILSINPTTDGIGFYYKVRIVFADKSEGDFRYFSRFEDYIKKNFLETLKYL